MKTLNLQVCAKVLSLIPCAREPAASLAGPVRGEMPASHPAPAPPSVSFRGAVAPFGIDLLHAGGALSPLHPGA